MKEMKICYNKLNLGWSISSEMFNFMMILLVKIIAYFLGNKISIIKVDLELECDIYQQTMHSILGIASLI